MESLININIPSKEERKIAQTSYSALSTAMKQLKNENAEIEIEETGDKITLPLKALKLLEDVLKAMSKGKPISIVPIATEVTTQGAAEMLGCSRPYLIKLLEEGKIAYTTVGRHRRIRFEDVLNYKQQMQEEQKKHLAEMMKCKLNIYEHKRYNY